MVDKNPRPTRGIIRRSIRGSVMQAGGLLGWDQIAANARLIRDLGCTIRDRHSRGLGETDGAGATVSPAGMGDARMQALIAQRRRQTSRIAYGAFVVAWIVLGGWVWRAITSEWSASRVVAAIEFMPFCAILFLMAFKYAHLNWQLRTGRRGSAGDYLRSADRFWPS